ncbi:MAG: hypothetical protein KF729_06530 [Sandaracinaceae bacterium]|nr:hypothetical protein [Sandaracinaceae bacterium]
MARHALSVAWIVTLAVVGAFVARWLGWLDGPGLLDLGMGAAALVGLLAVLWVPWDLYYAARRLCVDQRESVARGVEVPAEDRASAAAMPPRLLALALGLHALGAGVVAGVTFATGGGVGYWFAGFYVLGTLLRPIGALYGHVRERLRDLSERARYPREDVIALREDVRGLLAALEALETSVVPSLREADEAGRAELSRRDDEARRREARFEQKVDAVLAELERSVGRLTADRELLEGIRAFVRLVKTT